MAQTLNVLLYSKYSPLSQGLITNLGRLPPEVLNAVSIRQVCIDHKAIRARIEQNTKIHIDLIPCLLVVYPNGTVEKYEGSDSLHWVNETVSKLMPPEPEMAQQPIQSSRPKKPKQSSQRTSRPPPETDSEEECVEDIPESPPPRAKPRKKHRPRTSLIEVSGGDEDVDFTERPLVPVRDGAGSYKFTREFGEEQEPNREVHGKVKGNTQPTKPENGLMAAAMAMQKERESVDSRATPPTLGDPPNQRPI